MIAPRSSCPGEECYSSPGRSRSSDQYEINNSNAQIGCLRPRLPGVSFSPQRGAAVTFRRSYYRPVTIVAI